MKKLILSLLITTCMTSSMQAAMALGGMAVNAVAGHAIKAGVGTLLNRAFGRNEEVQVVKNITQSAAESAMEERLIGTLKKAIEHDLDFTKTPAEIIKLAPGHTRELVGKAIALQQQLNKDLHSALADPVRTEQLLVDGANPNTYQQNKTPLLKAVADQHESVTTLLSFKARCDLPDKETGLYPLHVAASKNNLTIAQILVNHGASATQTTIAKPSLGEKIEDKFIKDGNVLKLLFPGILPPRYPHQCAPQGSKTYAYLVDQLPPHLKPKSITLGGVVFVVVGTGTLWLLVRAATS